MSNEYEREDMLSILRKYRPIYFAVFLAQVIAWCVITTWWEATSGEHTDDVLGMVIAIGLKMAPLMGLSIITTIVLVDIGRYLVVLLPTPNVRRKIMEKAESEGRAAGMAAGMAEGMAAGMAAGMAEERRNWVAWNRRRKEAETQGLPFNEPSPGSDEDIE